MKEFETITQKITPNFLQLTLTLLVTVLLGLSIYYLINIGNSHIEKRRRINIDLKLFTKILGVGVLIYIGRGILNKFPIIGNTIGAMFIAVILAYVMNPVVSYLERKGLKRQYGVLVVYITIVVVFIILSLVVFPKTVDEIRKLFSSLPQYVEEWSNKVINWVNSIDKGNDLPFNLENLESLNNMETTIDNLLTSLQTEAISKIKSIASGITSVFSRIISFVLIFIFSFYFCVDKDKFQKLIYKNLPDKYEKDILFLAREINEALLEFVKGKLLLAVFVGISTTIMLLILRVDFAIVIGIITCIADIIPYIGPFLGFLPAFLFAAIDSKVKALWVGIFFVFLQWAENNVLAPKILGNKTGLHPLIILLCIVIGGGMFGFGGMILSVPFVSIFLIIKDFAILKYREAQTRKQID